jgi:hypothetical protein
MSPTPFQQAMAEAAMRPMDVQAQLARFERQKAAIENANQYMMQPTKDISEQAQGGATYIGPKDKPAMDFISQLNEHFGSPARSETALPSMVAYDELMAGNKAIADKFEELRQERPIPNKELAAFYDNLREEASDQYMEAVKNAINRRIGEKGGGITREDLPGAYGVPYDLQAEISDEHPLGYRYKRPSVSRATGGAYYDEVAENVLGRPPSSFNRYNHKRTFPASIGQHVAEVNMQQREQLAQDMGYPDRYDMPREVYDAYMKRRDAMEAPPTQQELSDIFSYLQTPPKPQYTPPPQTEFERFGRPLSDVQTGEPMDIAMRLLKDDTPADYADTFHRVRNNIGADGGYMTDEELSAIDERYTKLEGDGHFNLLEMIEEEQKRRRNHSFEGIRQNEETGFTRSNPMNLAFRLLKERKSPEAMRHKLEYDKQYESSPERVKYRTELNRERRRRGIMGSGDHKDVSHTQGGRLTLESEHDNRARHFKNRGTLRQIDEVE